MIVDTHVHYLEPESADRPHDAEGNRGEALSVEDVVSLATSAGVDKIVQVTPSAMGWDNRYGLEGARRYPEHVLGVFGRFDPIAPDIEARLNDFMAQPGMLGVRLQARMRTSSETWLRDRALDPFLAIAEGRRIPVACFPPNQPKELRETARRFPRLALIADQMTLYAVARRTEDPFLRWDDVLALAAEPNVYTKVSVFPEAAPPGEGFPFPTAQRRFKELYEHAGPARLIWGSNYPSVARVCSYADALNFVRACDFLTAQDREAILGETFLAAFVR